MSWVMEMNFERMVTLLLGIIAITLILIILILLWPLIA